jgi:glycosyltransferase involved in cell wall biosynthesis
MFTSLVTAEEVAASRSMPAGRTARSDDDAETPFRIAWAGRIVADKGLRDLLGAVSALRDDGVEATLDVIGDGPDRPALEETARRLGLDRAVHWAGYIGDRDLYLARLRRANAFVLPSRAEGIPKVLVEAMAAGLPIVATAVGAVPGLLDAGRLGHLVPAADPRALAEAIRGLQADAAERMRLRVAGLDFAARHTIDAQAHHLIAWLRTTFPNLPWPGAEQLQ